MSSEPAFPQLARLEFELLRIYQRQLGPLYTNVQRLHELLAHRLAHRDKLWPQVCEARDNTEDLYDTTRAMLRCSRSLAQVAQHATDLAAAGKMLQRKSQTTQTTRKRRSANKGKQGKDKPTSAPPSQRTFRLFPLLLPELRIQIWEAAAAPPPCAHYFSHYDQDAITREPGAGFMPDRALWFACKESRHQMFLLYRRAQRAYSESQRAGGPDVCDKGSCPLWRTVGRLNDEGTLFRLQMHVLHSQAQDASDSVRACVEKVKKRDSEALVHITGCTEGWRMAQAKIMLQALQSICENLRAEGLY